MSIKTRHNIDQIKIPPSTPTGKYYISINKTGSNTYTTSLIGQPVEIGLAGSDETSNLTTGVSELTFRIPFAMKLSTSPLGVRANVNTAPTGTKIIVDIKEGGVSILSTLLSIDTSEKTSVTASVPAVISDVNLADDAEMTIDITQIGSGVAGKGLKLWLLGIRT